MHLWSYYYGPMFGISGSATDTPPLGTYKIDFSFKSLRSLFWMLIPSAYRNNPYIRWLRKKACNLKNAKVRIGT